MADSDRMTMLPGFSFQVLLGTTAFAFQKVSSMEESIEVQIVQEGGVNDRVHALHAPVSGEKTLVMERGIPVGKLETELSNESESAKTFRVGKTFSTAQILVCNRKKNRIARAYLVSKLMLKSWSLSELDAMRSDYLVERMEFTYEHIDRHTLQKTAMTASGSFEALSGD